MKKNITPSTIQLLKTRKEIKEYQLKIKKEKPLTGLLKKFPIDKV